MITVLAVAILLCTASLVVGRAALVFTSGRGQIANLGLAPAIGLAALMALAVLGSRIADGAGAAIAMALLCVASLAFVRRGGIGNAALAALVVLAGLAAAALPFLLAGHSGILGAALINDDMASHLQIAEHVRSPLADAPRFAEGGYPIGPHAIVAGLAEGLGISIVDAFAALTIALAPLLALTLLAALDHLPPLRRVLAALVAALSYLSAAYIGQGAFKEPLEALIVIAFAIYVADLVGLGRSEPAVAGDRPAFWRAVPAGLLAAASVLNYSLPGLVWIAAVAAAILVLRYYVLGPRPQGLAIAWRRLLPYGARRPGDRRGRDGVRMEPDRRVHQRRLLPPRPGRIRPRQSAPVDLAGRGAWRLADRRLPHHRLGRRAARGALLARRGAGARRGDRRLWRRPGARAGSR